MPGADEAAKGLAYLFASSGSGRIFPVGDGAESFAAVELTSRGIVVVPASSPAWQIEELEDGLELIRITPRWPHSAGDQA